MRECEHSYDDIISVENLLEAWQEFERGKKKKQDVVGFKRHLMTNIVSLHKDLREKIYTHGTYHHFVVCDPKRRGGVLDDNTIAAILSQVKAELQPNLSVTSERLVTATESFAPDKKR
jgi:hypothetical protein